MNHRLLVLRLRFSCCYEVKGSLDGLGDGRRSGQVRALWTEPGNHIDSKLQIPNYPEFYYLTTIGVCWILTESSS